MKARKSKVRFPTDSGHVKASLTVPRVVAGGAVLLHGLCVDRDEYDCMYVDLADALAEADIATLRFDFAGHGRRRKQWRRFSIAGQFAETCAAVDWLARELDTPPGRIRLCGTSFGAPPAIFAADAMDDLVDRVALISPVLDYRSTFLDPICPWGHENFGREAIKRARGEERLLIGGEHPLPVRLFDEMQIVDPLDRLARLQAATLLIHGAADSMVPVGPAREAGRLRGVRYVEEPEMDHGPFHREDETGEAPASASLKRALIARVAAHLSEGL